MEKLKTKDRIIEAADQLFYQKGFDHTTFGDISEAVQISRGNFYHHYKTKDAILDAVIKWRLKNAQKLLSEWDAANHSPVERIRSFINELVINRLKIRYYGCRAGTLCSELAKLDHALLPQARKIFTLFRDWLCKQFHDLGRTHDADKLALHVLAQTQGIATLANAFGDEDIIDQEVNQLDDWLIRL